MRVEVETAPAADGKHVPIRLVLGSRRIDVAAILDRWPGADYRYFKIRGADAALYILRHDEVRDRWDLTLFERSPS